ncbi:MULTISPECIES: NADAR family protein [Legionella]|uniref:NADAR family protein n=1 Tax=Legionella septentrionalis TaxID=2498109 RepID=A0A433JHX0_9GAMM|nr:MULTISPECIES: NADAR family protein [Legionella]MCP0913680.1 NADAR family protein [Legionella sp. 27cVA30]RUQ84459.1 NADAR family protein [Legionella septentrionalis]RUQ93698.1 NADAR family protein [Legionella septentrionalis]RUR09262.1 NADAR family protein [Legionella septentrionalis]RUR14470.1 NADAR family protein [Legionella septentrionalis]
MPIPYLQRNGVKIAPFKNPEIEPYGAFANTTEPGEHPIDQTVILGGKNTTLHWPSSEHAFHAQKIIYLKEQLGQNHPAQATLTKMVKEIESTNKVFMPRDDYDPLVRAYLPELRKHGLNVSDKQSFDKLCGADYHAVHNPNGERKTLDFMRTVVQLKLAQNPELREKAIECAKNGIMPVEVSRYDVNWASGDNGKGQNMLGVIILEEGNKLLAQQGGTPAIPNPAQAYRSIQQNQDLSHNALAPLLSPTSKNWVIPNAMPSMSELPSNRFHAFEFDEVVKNLPSRVELETTLRKGKVPLLDREHTILDAYIRSNSNQYKNEAAEIIPQYAVKNVMNDFNTQVNVKAVENSRAGTQGHDNHAIKVTFASQKEAEAFCQKLHKEHGIHSHTFGAGVSKTAQNGSVYLTKQDLEKLTQDSKLCKQSGAGALVYESHVKAYQQHDQQNLKEAVPSLQSMRPS